MRQLFKQVKWVFLVIVFTSIAIFAYQNAALVEIQFLAWKFEARRVFVILTSLIAGGLVGWLFGATSRRKRGAF